MDEMNWIGIDRGLYSFIIYCWSAAFKFDQVQDMVAKDFNVRLPEAEYKAFCALLDMQLERDIGDK